MKRYVLIFTLLFSFLVSSALTPKWIAADDSTCNAPNSWSDFHKDFHLKKVAGKVYAKIAADSKYWLWVNDSLAVFEGGLKRGPNPSDSYYDVVDLTPFLKKGKNHLKILSCYFGKPGFSHLDSGQAGIIFDAPSIGVVSDASWQSRILPEYQTAGNPVPNFRLSESNILYDARLTDTANLHPSIEKGSWGDAPWNNLIERPIPLWKDHGIKLVESGWQSSESNGYTTVSLRLPYNMQFTPFIEIYDPAGRTPLKIETDHVHGGSQDCVRAEYISKNGKQSHESLGWMNGDFLNVLYPSESGIKINAIGYRETGYDADFEGKFLCNDEFINRFWEKAMRTLYVNMRDNYFDCPDRERAQWWGDVTILMGQSFYQLSPKANALMRKAINELTDWQKPDGVLFSPIPAQNWDRELPAQMLAAISTYGFWYYYIHTEDKETMEHVYPAMRRYLSIWQLDDDGLTVERSGGWPWGDWGANVDMRLILASWHYLALQSAINVANLMGKVQDIPDYTRQMDSIKKAFNNCWNGYAYRHPSYQGATDDRVQAMAVITGLADESKYEPIFQLFKSQEHASPYMEKYVLEALMKTGHGKYALQRFKKRFGEMVTDTIHSTLYEGWKEGGYGGGSTNHAWSGGMLTVIAEQVCGVKPIIPGWKEFEVKPNPVISECSIEIPSVSGKIKSSFKDSDEAFMLDVTVPQDTKANIVIPDSDYSEITVNGKKGDPTKLHSVGKGNYKIICKKNRMPD